MSLTATRWAWSAPVENSGQRLVLLNLADRANKQGECWPSQERIARDTNLSERSVRNRMKELEETGFIKRRHRKNGAGRTSDLTVLMIDGQPNASTAKTGTPPSATNAATNRQNSPEDTGKPRRQTDQDSTDQTEHNKSNGSPVWLERMPQSGRPDIDRYNRAVAFAAEVAQYIACADWNSPGLENLNLVEGWLERFDVPLLRDCLIETAARAARAGTTIQSWEYFAMAVEKLPTKGK
jgi:biotin operon repressor